MSIRRPAAVAVVLVSLAAVALVGCAGPGTLPAPSVSKTVPPSASGSVSPSPSATDADTRLFTISATVRAVDNTSVSISLVAQSPVASTSVGADALASTLLDTCPAAMTVSDAATPLSRESLVRFGSSLLGLSYRATPEKHTFLAPIDLALGSEYAARAATGTGLLSVDQNETCTGHYQLTGSGSGVAVVDYESGATAVDNGKWSYGHYGFTVPFESGATIENCEITLTALAIATVSAVPGWDPDAEQSGVSCGIGYAGE